MTINAGKYMFEDTSSDTDVVLETNPPNIMNRIGVIYMKDITTSKLSLMIRLQLKLHGHIPRKDGLENSVIPRNTDVKRRK